MIIYPPELQITDSDFVYNFVATYHISKIYTQRTMVQFNFTDYKIQTGLSLDANKVNCTNLTWSIYSGCYINTKNETIQFTWVQNYTKREDKI